MSITKVIGAVAAASALAASVITASPVQAATTHRLPSCRAQLAAYRLVSRQADLRIGSVLPGKRSGGGPAVWADELQAVNPELAATFRPVRDNAAMRQAVMAFTAAADADLTVLNGGSQAGICAR